ncbi:MAG: L-threonylcarbamoyladenylate synthase [Pirellulaceae bacterium]|nr:L-threonylcarbamoyladenylate synthase [Pirellulaceae bacterium]
MVPLSRTTQLLPATDSAIAAGAAILRRGGLVALPTETVYGLGADAENVAAVQAMFAAKGRPADHPVIVHLAAAEQISLWARDIPAAAWQLAAAFWPGPMTLVLPRSPKAGDFVTGGLDTVGLRVPGHPAALALLRAFGGAIAAPSANRFGHVSPTTAEHVRDELSGFVDLILDGGPCQVGLESTIIDLSRGDPAILRPGGITADKVAAVLRGALGQRGAHSPRVSGSLESHYAPRATVELITRSELAIRAAQLAGQGHRVAVLARPGDLGELPAGVQAIILPAGDENLARELYAALRRVDELGCGVALATLPAETGLGVAIADRLRRAAGPRESV